MPKSKIDKNRKQNLLTFKQKQKKMNEQQSNQQSSQKTHLIPQPEWNSKDILELRGDLLEALEKQFVLTYQHLQQSSQEFAKAGEVIRMIMGTNIKADKMKLKYTWNNGQEASQEEVKAYEAQMEEIRKAQKDQYENSLKEKNAEKTGLVTADGSPLGTTQNLDETHKVIHEADLMEG